MRVRVGVGVRVGVRGRVKVRVGYLVDEEEHRQARDEILQRRLLDRVGDRVRDRVRDRLRVRLSVRLRVRVRVRVRVREGEVTGLEGDDGRQVEAAAPHRVEALSQQEADGGEHGDAPVLDLGLAVELDLTLRDVGARSSTGKLRCGPLQRPATSRRSSTGGSSTGGSSSGGSSTGGSSSGGSSTGGSSTGGSSTDLRDVAATEAERVEEAELVRVRARARVRDRDRDRVGIRARLGLGSGLECGLSTGPLTPGIFSVSFGFQPAAGGAACAVGAAVRCGLCGAACTTAFGAATKPRLQGSTDSILERGAIEKDTAASLEGDQLRNDARVTAR